MAYATEITEPRIVDGTCVVPPGWICNGVDCGHGSGHPNQRCYYAYRCPTCGEHPHNCNAPGAK